MRACAACGTPFRFGFFNPRAWWHALAMPWVCAGWDASPNTIRLSQRDADLFLNALDNPEPPNERLVEAAKLQSFGAEFDALCRRHSLGFDDALAALADAVAADAARQNHDLVRDLLLAAEDQLRHASFNIYASYK